MECPECKSVNRIQTREHMICGCCGLVFHDLFENEDFYHTKKQRSKPYCFAHHFSERMAAFSMDGPTIPMADGGKVLLEFLHEASMGFDCEYWPRHKDIRQVTNEEPPEKWGPKTFTNLIKYYDSIEGTNFSKKKYHERWLWIRLQIGLHKDHSPPADLVSLLKMRYYAVYHSFEFLKRTSKAFRSINTRKNIININFIILQLLYQEDYHLEYGRYFGFIKGQKTNFNMLQNYWRLIKICLLAKYSEFYYPPLGISVKLEWKKTDLTRPEIESLLYFK